MTCNKHQVGMVLQSGMHFPALIFFFFQLCYHVSSVRTCWEWPGSQSQECIAFSVVSGPQGLASRKSLAATKPWSVFDNLVLAETWQGFWQPL